MYLKFKYWNSLVQESGWVSIICNFLHHGANTGWLLSSPTRAQVTWSARKISQNTQKNRLPNIWRHARGSMVGVWQTLEANIGGRMWRSSLLSFPTQIMDLMMGRVCLKMGLRSRMRSQWKLMSAYPRVEYFTQPASGLDPLQLDQLAT